MKVPSRLFWQLGICFLMTISVCASHAGDSPCASMTYQAESSFNRGQIEPSFELAKKAVAICEKSKSEKPVRTYILFGKILFEKNLTAMLLLSLKEPQR